MAKLTDTQLIILSKAARREDWAAEVPERMNKATAARVGASLVVRRSSGLPHPEGEMPAPGRYHESCIHGATAESDLVPVAGPATR